MLLQSLLAAALIASLAAQSAPATPTPLREIDRVGATSGICGNLVVHANSAIAAALHNDQVVARLVDRLRAIDLEANDLSRRNGLAELGRLAADLHEQALRGDEELKRLGDLSEHSSDAAHRADETIFAGALGGVFGRQRRIASDVASFINFVDYRDTSEIPNPVNNNRGSVEIPAIPGNQPPPAPVPIVNSPYERAGSPNRMARAMAVDLQGRGADVKADEAHAASYSESAVTGCV